MMTEFSVLTTLSKSFLMLWTSLQDYLFRRENTLSEENTLSDFINAGAVFSERILTGLSPSPMQEI